MSTPAKPPTRTPSFINDGTDPHRPKWVPPVVEEMPDADGQFLLTTRYGKYVQFLEKLADALVAQSAIPEALDVMNLLMKYGHDVTKVKLPEGHKVNGKPNTRVPKPETPEKPEKPPAMEELPDVSGLSDAELEQIVKEGE